MILGVSTVFHLHFYAHLNLKTNQVLEKQENKYVHETAQMLHVKGSINVHLLHLQVNSCEFCATQRTGWWS